MYNKLRLVFIEFLDVDKADSVALKFDCIKVRDPLMTSCKAFKKSIEYNLQDQKEAYLWFKQKIVFRKASANKFYWLK